MLEDVVPENLETRDSQVRTTWLKQNDVRVVSERPRQCTSRQTCLRHEKHD